MENEGHLGLEKHAYPEEFPSPLKYVTSKAIAGFDNVEYDGGVNSQCQSPNAPSHLPDPISFSGTEAATFQRPVNCSTSANSTDQAIEPHVFHAFSMSTPTSPHGLHREETKRVLFSHEVESNAINEQPNLPSSSGSLSAQPKLKFRSQTLTNGATYNEATTEGKVPEPSDRQEASSCSDMLKDKRFDSFKTWSGKLERQLSALRGKPPLETEISSSQNTEIEDLPVDRYYDALEGPELDTLKASEELVLPEDKKWPFLLRYPISSFGICLGVSSQAILWKTLATSPSTEFLHVSPSVNLVLWCISLALMANVSFVYSLKIIFYFEAVRREYYHPIRVNFFFAPWIACLFLTLGVPQSVAVRLHTPLWYVLMAPIFCLELKIYGQWMSGGQRRLSKVANPSNHLSIVGNFVGALLGASMGLKEGPIFFFAIGLAHYIVLFVTLYQRLPTNETLPKELHPVFFLFVAAPSVASMAWAKISGEFDYGSRIVLFTALFLYGSLAVRINFFRGFRFSLAWWAYTFPMTGASIATIRYSTEVKNTFTQSLSVALSAISTLTVTALLVSTIIHAFVYQDLFPNDIAIAITNKKHTSLSSASSNAKDLELAL